MPHDSWKDVTEHSIGAITCSKNMCQGSVTKNMENKVEEVEKGKAARDFVQRKYLLFETENMSKTEKQ